MYRVRNDSIEVLLAHPGGPLFVNKDDGAWTIPKGEPDAGEDLFRTAEREFAEETGIQPRGPYIQLAPIVQKGGKIVHAWAFAGDCDPAAIRSSLFSLEWPPKSGRQLTFPEVDRADFFDIDRARQKIKPAQMPLVDELVRHLQR